MTLRVLKWVTEQLLVSKKVAMATVMSTSGSVPGKSGARLGLTTDSIIGTIGGAGLEVKVIQRLREMLSEATTATGEVQTYGLNRGAKGYEVIPLDSLRRSCDSRFRGDYCNATYSLHGWRSLCKSHVSWPSTIGMVILSPRYKR